MGAQWRAMLLVSYTLVLLLLLLVVVATAATTSASAADIEDELQQWPIMSRAAFTTEECNAISTLYIDKLQRIQDTREAESVSRINRFDVKQKLLKQGQLDWILDRVAQRLGAFLFDQKRNSNSGQDGQALKEYVDFTLLHEFNPGMHFGLHVDTRPNDNTYRTYNVNIMLSDVVEDYKGGALQVGNGIVKGLKKGDLYMYPASLPHAVHSLESGLRYTYVMALRVPKHAVEGNNHNRAAYWAAAESRLQALAVPAGRMGEMESKLHLIHAEFLEAAGDRTDADIDAAYCKSYKVTAEAQQYAERFFQDGVAAAQQSGDPAAAANYFQMAACIDPTNVQAARALEQVRRVVPPDL